MIATAAAKDPTPYLWWLAGRASGIVALALVTVAVLLGLTMSSRLLRRPGIARTLLSLHEHVALVGLGAIAVHGLTLLADPWLKPGVSGVTVPFAMSYRPLYTGLGIVSGYLAALLGLSFYARKRIGARRWRKLHRATFLVWALGAVHALGGGSDGSTQWLRAFVLLPAIPIAYLATVRVLSARRRKPTPQRQSARVVSADGGGGHQRPTRIVPTPQPESR